MIVRFGFTGLGPGALGVLPSGFLSGVLLAQTGTGPLRCLCFSLLGGPVGRLVQFVRFEGLWANCDRC